MLKKDLSFFISAIVMVVCVFTYLIFEFASPVPTEEVVFIEEGTNKTEVIKDLHRRGFIKNKVNYYYALTTSFLSGDKEILAGGYVFRNGLTASAIQSSLQQEAEYKYVAVIEGMRKEEIAERVGSALSWEEEKIKTFKTKYPTCAFAGREGYLAPGEYLIKRDADIQGIQEKMEGEFAKKLQKLKIDRDDVDLDKIITVASLIQRESGGKKDMRLISGVIWNRLDLGMPLQIDATLQYVKGDDELWWPRVRSEDKYLDSPYNTYKNEGLPPQPISNPGSAAIAAALDPANTSCLFYLHDTSGNIHCSTTYDGHLDNIKRYLK